MITIKVAIIDDEINDLNRVKDYFTSLSNHQMNYKCDLYTEINQKFYEHYDLYVVDIELENASGLEISKDIKQKCPQSVLIINSKRNDLVFETFKFGAFFFIRKDHFNEDMEFCKSRLDEHFNIIKKEYIYHNKQDVIHIPYQNIMFIEKVDRNIEFHLNNGKSLIENKTIKQIVNEIKSSTFIQCHQSYYVNLSYVKKIEKDDFIIQNHHVQISRRYLSKVKQAYMNYLRKKV